MSLPGVPSTRTTTLYELIAILQEEVPAHEDRAIVALLVQWFSTGRLRLRSGVSDRCAGTQRNVQQSDGEKIHHSPASLVKYDEVGTGGLSPGTVPGREAVEHRSGRPRCPPD